MELTPAYGRDYKTGKDAKAAFLSGKDWIVASMFDRYAGKPTNISDLCRAGERSVILRFNRMTKVTSVSLTQKLCAGLTPAGGASMGRRTAKRRRARR